VTPTQATSPWSPQLRRPLLADLATGAALLLLCCCLGLLVLQWQTDLTSIDVGGAALANRAGINSDLIVAAVIAGGFIVATAISPWRRVLGLTLPPQHPLAGAVTATVFTVWISAGVALITSYISAYFFPTQQDPSVSRVFADLPTGSRALTSLHAGLQEEALDLVLPLALAVIVMLLVRLTRRQPTSAAALSEVPLVWRIGVLAATLGLITRVLDHLYQGPVYAASAVVWGLGFLVIFAVCRSIWPLIVGHFLYDFAVVIFLPGHPVRRSLVVLVVGAAALALTWRMTRGRERAGSPTTPAPAGAPVLPAAHRD